jgi:RNA polymerase sigma factor (sigma-70 family)
MDRYVNNTDSEILAKYSEGGDTGCIAELYKRYGHLVLGLCLKYLKNREDAEDAVSAIFAKLMADLKKHKVEHFKSWLYVFSRNHCLMELRKRSSALRKELELRENNVIFMDSADKEHLIKKERQAELLFHAIEGLGEGQRRCVRLFYLEGRSYSEIVQLTGYSEKEVKSHIQNGKRNLKIKLETQINE